MFLLVLGETAKGHYEGLPAQAPSRHSDADEPPPADGTAWGGRYGRRLQEKPATTRTGERGWESAGGGVRGRGGEGRGKQGRGGGWEGSLWGREERRYEKEGQERKEMGMGGGRRDR